MPYADDISKLMTFNPYVETTPVETLKTAGIMRQQKYDDNLQRLQSAYQETKSLETQLPDKPGLKEYFNTKINSIKNSTREAITGDLSNQSLVSTIGGAIKNISNDNIIRKGLTSSLTINNETKRMQEKIDKGESSPANEFYFQQQVSSYLQNPDLEQSFNGKYDPYFDIWKYAKDTFDTIKPGTVSWDEVYIKDPKTGAPAIDKSTGQPVFSPIMMRHIREGRDMNAVNSAISQIFQDPRVQKQLGIDGNFNYRNYAPEQLHSEVKSIIDKSLLKAREQLNNINLEIETGDPKNKEKYKEAYSKLETQIKEKELEYKPMLDAAYTNPDQIKQFLNKRKVTDNFTNIFGAQYESTKVESNAGWEASFKMRKEERESREFWANFNQRAQFHNDEQRFKYESLNYQKQKDAADKKAEGVQTFVGANPSEYDYLSLATKNVSSADKELDDSKLDLLSLYYVPKQQGLTQEQKRNYVKTYIEKNKIPDSWLEDRINHITKNINTFTKQEPVNEILVGNYENAVKQFYATQPQRTILNDIYKDIPKVQPFDYTTDEGKKIKINQKDMLDLALALVPGTKLFEGGDEKQNQQAAIKRLENSGLGEIYRKFSSSSKIKGLLSQNVGSFGQAFFNKIGEIGDAFNKEDIISGMAITQANSKHTKVFNAVLPLLKKLHSDEFKQSINIKKEDLKKQVVDQSTYRPLFTGKNEEDEKMNQNLIAMSRTYQNQDGSLFNTSSDFEGFANNIGKKGFVPVVVSDLEGITTVNLYDNTKEGDNKLVGSMTINPTEKDKVEFLSPYLNYRASQPVSQLMNFMNLSGGVSYNSKSYDYKISDPELYKIGQSWFKKEDFPNVQNPNYDIKVNFKNQKSTIFPYVYINDKSSNKEPIVIPFDPRKFKMQGYSPDQQLDVLLKGLPQLINDTYIQGMLNN